MLFIKDGKHADTPRESWIYETIYISYEKGCINFFHWVQQERWYYLYYTKACSISIQWTSYSRQQTVVNNWGKKLLKPATRYSQKVENIMNSTMELSVNTILKHIRDGRAELITCDNNNIVSGTSEIEL